MAGLHNNRQVQKGSFEKPYREGGFQVPFALRVVTFPVTIQVRLVALANFFMEKRWSSAGLAWTGTPCPFGCRPAYESKGVPLWIFGLAMGSWFSGSRVVGREATG